jgi:hypothetical protein
MTVNSEFARDANHRQHLTAFLGVALVVAGALAGRQWLAAGQAGTEPDVAAVREEVGAARERCQRATQRLEVTSSRLLESQERLESFNRERLEDLRQAAEGHSLDSDYEGATAATANSDEASELPVPNPARQRLSGRLRELEAERSRLLERLTVEHPLVNDVDVQIADVERQLETQRHTASTAVGDLGTADEGSPPKSSRSASTRLRKQWQGLIDEAAAGSKPIEDECRLIERELVAIQAERSRADKEYAATSDRLAALLVTPPTIEATAQGRFAMVVGGGLSLVAGFVLLVRSIGAARSRDAVLNDARDVERWFALPVAGMLATGSAIGAEIVPSSLTSRPAGRLPLVVQLAVAVVLFLLVAMTIQDPSWIGQLSAQPIVAFEQAFSRLAGN